MTVHPTRRELRGTSTTVVDENLTHAEYYQAPPQFDDPRVIDDAELAAETKELEALVPSYAHDYFDIFRKKQGTTSLPPPREYDMKIELKPEGKLPIAKLYQLSEEQKKVLMDTLDRETKAGRIRPSNAQYGSPSFFVRSPRRQDSGGWLWTIVS